MSHIYKDEPYIAASPEGLMSCKCNARFKLEIKCLFNIRRKEITDSMKEYKILTISSRNITINIGHKYYAQIVSQMAITETRQTVFIVWTLYGSFVEYIPSGKNHWGNVKTNIKIFFKAYVCPTK